MQDLSNLDESIKNDNDKVIDHKEVFSFFQTDREIVDLCNSALRQLLMQSDLTPKSIVDIGLMLHATDCLPLVIPDFDGTIATKSDFVGSSVTRSISLNDVSFNLTTLEVFADAPAGSEWCASIEFEVGVGWREPMDFNNVCDWFDLFIQSEIVETEVCLEGKIDWEVESVDEAWDRLEEDPF